MVGKGMVEEIFGLFYWGVDQKCCGVLKLKTLPKPTRNRKLTGKIAASTTAMEELTTDFKCNLI